MTKKPPEVKEAEAALGELGYTSVRFAPAGGPGSYVFRGAAIESVTAGERPYSAFQIAEAASGVRFWLAGYMDFTITRGTAVFDQVGFLLLGGTLVTAARVLFRAEWDPKAFTHAQPHWHVYGSALHETFEIERATETDVERLDVSRFHFAMSARWAEGLGHHQTLEPGQMRPWVKGCVEYCRQQIAYLCKKAVSDESHTLGDLLDET